jgi:hypothetical protein
MTRTRVASSQLDTVSGHEEDQDRKQERESLYVTITEAARRSGVSTKTIQRAIQAGRLVAHYPQPNRCEIDVAELDIFLHGQISGHVQIASADRLAELEQRVQHLEYLVQELLSRQEISPSKQTTKRQERTTGLLPKQFVSLLTFALHHNVSEATVQTHMDMGLLPVKRGAWTDADGKEVILALDVKGRTAFYQMYRSFPHFMKCHQCPHGYQDSVSGQR